MTPEPSRAASGELREGPSHVHAFKLLCRWDAEAEQDIMRLFQRGDLRASNDGPSWVEILNILCDH